MTNPEQREKIARDALEAIERWDMPSTGKFWMNADGTLSDRPMSYGAEYGSNGEQNYIRNLARTALAAIIALDPAPESAEAYMRMIIETADYTIQQYKAVWMGKVVRDLDEAEGAYNAAKRATLARSSRS